MRTTEIKDRHLAASLNNIRKASDIVSVVESLNDKYLSNHSAELVVTTNFCDDEPLYEVSISTEDVSFTVISLNKKSKVAKELPDIEYLLENKLLGKRLLTNITTDVRCGNKSAAALHNLKRLFESK